MYIHTKLLPPVPDGIPGHTCRTTKGKKGSLRALPNLEKTLAKKKFTNMTMTHGNTWCIPIWGCVDMF